MRGDTHLRHHGQWRTCVKAACNAAALVASPQSKMKTSRFRHDPEMTPPQRKVGCKNLHKTDQVQLGGREWAPRLTLADVTVARICTKLTKVQLCGCEWCTKTDPPAPLCASNPEARLKYLKYPSPHRLSGLGESSMHDPNTNLRYSPPAFAESASFARASTETEPRPEA